MIVDGLFAKEYATGLKAKKCCHPTLFPLISQEAKF
jgi:hypothetical protein